MLSMVAMKAYGNIWYNSGLWPPHDQQKSKSLYTVYTIFLIVCLYVPFPLFLTISLYYANSVVEFTEIILIWPTAAFGIKATLIVWNRQNIERLFEQLELMDEFVRLDEHRDIVGEQTRQSQCWLRWLRIEFYVSITTHWIMGLLDGELMWPIWAPIDFQKNFAAYLMVNMYLYVVSLFNG